MKRFIAIAGCLLMMSSKLLAQQAEASGDPNLLDRMCFSYGKTGWEIATTAKQRRFDEARAKALVDAYFPPEGVPAHKDLIGRLYSGEFAAAEDLAGHMYGKCLDNMPPHPLHKRPAEKVVKECYRQLVLPHYVYVKKYGERVSKADLLSNLPKTLDAVQTGMLTRSADTMYSSDDPQNDLMAYWLVFSSCTSTAK